MNKEQFLSVLRDILKVVGTYVATSGVVTTENWEILVGVALVIGGSVWSHFVHQEEKPAE